MFNAKEKFKEKFKFNRLETQLKGALIQLEDLRNDSMRSTLIFKNIDQKPIKTWEDNTSKILAEFLTSEEIHMQISRAHQGTGRDIKNNSRACGPKPISAQFVNWRSAQEVWNKVIHLNAQQEVNVVVSHMFSKELMKWRNGALKYNQEYITNNQDVQIKLEYPATLKSRQKGSRGK